MNSRIVVTTLGSLGDLHPSLAIALGLQERGHSVVMAVSDDHREFVTKAGMEFAPMRPNFLDRVDKDPEMMARLMDPNTGARMLLGELVMPAVRDSYDDLTAASKGANAIISHTLTAAAPMVAQKMNIPWASVVLAPLSFFSAYEHNHFNPEWLSDFIARFNPSTRGMLLQWLSSTLVPLGKPVVDLRRELKLSPAKYPVFDGQVSQYLTLATFSRALASPQPDWPSNALQTGYCFYDGSQEPLVAEIEDFLSAGDPPIVFTLGSSCVWAARDFYAIAAQAAIKVNKRALLLIGKDPRNREGLVDHPDILAAAYAPHSLVFARAAAIVHQGGVGTTGQALRSGRPSVIMPFAFDQLDNASRCVRRDCAVLLRKARLTVDTMADALSSVLQSKKLLIGAARTAEIVRSENGVDTACGAIEKRLLRRSNV